jgi:hypothetical protein
VSKLRLCKKRLPLLLPRQLRLIATSAGDNEADGKPRAIYQFDTRSLKDLSIFAILLLIS